MTLEDFNDNAPVFKPSNVYHANISEGQDIDSEALRVETFDPDKNQIVTYQIQNAETSAFRINPNTGRILLIVCLFDCLFILFCFIILLFYYFIIFLFIHSFIYSFVHLFIYLIFLDYFINLLFNLFFLFIYLFT